MCTESSHTSTSPILRRGRLAVRRARKLGERGEVCKRRSRQCRDGYRGTATRELFVDRHGNRAGENMRRVVQQRGQHEETERDREGRGEHHNRKEKLREMVNGVLKEREGRVAVADGAEGTNAQHSFEATSNQVIRPL